MLSRESHSVTPPDVRSLRPLQGTEDELRAMKRALARADLGPVAVLALTNAILSLQRDARSD